MNRQENGDAILHSIAERPIVVAVGGDLGGDVGPPVVDGQCPHCNSTFGTFMGRRLHERKAHASLYHLDVAEEVRIKGRSHFLWTEHEESVYIDTECDLRMSGIEGSMQIVEGLVQALPGRSFAAVKKRRNNRSYMDGVEEEMERRQALQRERENPVEDLDPPDMEQELADLEIEQGVIAKFREIFTEHGEEVLGELWDPDDPYGIRREPAVVDEFTRRILAQNGLTLRRESRTNGRRPPRLPPVDENRNRRKARMWELTQSKWAKNRGRTIKELWNGTLENGGGVDRDVLVEYWSRVFEIEPQYEEIQLENKPILHHLDDPISMAEILEGLKRLTDSASGSDGLSRSNVRSVRKTDLLLLSRIFQASCYMPSQLRRGLVTLVPKVAKPEDPSQYRPITVGSMLLRLHHGILARRLDCMPVSTAQKAYQSIDGIAENVWIITELLEHAKTNGKEVHLVFLDVAKAFDSVSHKAISKSLQVLGVPKNTRKYIDGVYADSHVSFKGGDVQTNGRDPSGRCYVRTNF